MKKSRVYITSQVNLEDDEQEFRFEPGGFFTYWLTLKNRSLLSKYHVFQFMMSKSNTATTIVLQILITICGIYKSWSTFALQGSALSLVNFIFAMLFVVLLGWSIVYTKLRTSQKKAMSSKYSMLIESAWLLGVNIWFMLNFLLSRDESCTHGKPHGCKFFAMADEKVLVALLLPMISYMMMRCARWEIVILSYVMNVVIIEISIYCLNFDVSYMVFWSFLPFTILCLCEYQRQLLYQFAFVIIQQGILDEKTRRFDEMQKNELKHLIGNVALDLKTPLSSFVQGVEMIKSTAEEVGSSLLKEGFDRNVVIEQVADIVEKAVNILNTNSFMLMTMNRCIDYAKTNKNMKLQPQLESISLQETIDLPIQCMKDLQSDDIDIYANPLPRNIASTIETDKLWLQENLLCLMRNAVKYSTVGNVVLTVSLQHAVKMKSALMYDTYETSESTYQLALFNSTDDCEKTITTNSTTNMALRFEVEDTGIGLTDEAMATLFKPSKQAERLASGTGLGLFSLAKRMEALGGSYGVQKRRDGKRGSIFWFEIPYRPLDEPPKTLSLSISLDSMSSQGVVDSEGEDMPILRDRPGRLNILVVEDCEFINKTCRTMFKRAGHNVTSVENGAEALEMMKNNKHGPEKDIFDVVLMDLDMPVMNGLESTARLRAYEEQYCKNFVHNELLGSRDTSHLLIIGVSPTPDRDTIKESFIAGVDAFIPKPFNLKSFTEVYTSLVSRPAGY